MTGVEFNCSKTGDGEDAVGEGRFADTWGAKKKDGGVVPFSNPFGNGLLNSRMKTCCGGTFH